MDWLDDMISRLKSLEDDVISAIKAALKENEEIIVEMNSEEQLFERGVDSTGTAIVKYAPYSPITIQLKKIKRQPTARVTLRDEGDFHASFYIHFAADEFEIKASNWKANMLLEGYGENILGLTDENFRDVADNYIAPEIIKLFREI